jgi:sigma-70-like protein
MVGFQTGVAVPHATGPARCSARSGSARCARAQGAARGGPPRAARLVHAQSRAFGEHASPRRGHRSHVSTPLARRGARPGRARPPRRCGRAADARPSPPRARLERRPPVRPRDGAARGPLAGRERRARPGGGAVRPGRGRAVHDLRRVVDPRVRREVRARGVLERAAARRRRRAPRRLARRAGRGPRRRAGPGGARGRRARPGGAKRRRRARRARARGAPEVAAAARPVAWDIVARRLQQSSPATLREIGEHWGLSRERVRQVEARTKATLQRELARTLDVRIAAPPRPSRTPSLVPGSAA